MHLWQEHHSDDDVFSLYPIRQYIILISPISVAINFDLLKMISARLHREVTHFPFVIDKHVGIGRVTLRLQVAHSSSNLDFENLFIQIGIDS